MKMKKIIAMLLALCMVLAFAGCAAAPAEPTVPTTDAPTAAPTQAATEPATEAPTAPVEAETDVMSHADYMAAEVDAPVIIETYVQAHQSWWDNKLTVYAQSEDGAYFIYDMECSEEDAAKLVPGTKIRVTGVKAEWNGEVEIMDGTFEILEGSYVAPATDLTDLFGTEDLLAHQNELVSFKGLTVEAANDDGAAFLYKWDGSGEEGDDLYFNVSLNGKTYSFTVESYLCDKDSEVYNAVKSLKVGDVIDIEGFLYWYNDAQLHTTSVTAAG